MLLSYQKNALLSLLAQFEAKLYDTRSEIDDKTNAMSSAGKFSEASAHSFIFEIILRNIQSTRKQINKL